MTSDKDNTQMTKVTFSYGKHCVRFLPGLKDECLLAHKSEEKRRARNSSFHVDLVAPFKTGERAATLRHVRQC